MSKTKNPNGVSRRSFLKGAGLSAAGATFVNSSIQATGEMAKGVGDSAARGPGAVPILLRINGEEKKIVVEPRTTLADALREELEMTGTKISCDRGACSACTVMIEGKPVCSCMTLAVEAEGREVTTIEGLARNGKLHPVQTEFVNHDAMQCGFCTPGMVMSCAALLERNPNPSREDVQTATSGNLCRCGTYPKVFDATLAAAKHREKGS
ncbi:MAG: (2Fe-2S)-binding protein [Thermoanaerobaculia bacterium]|nr:(2Fe-2S)-binding protein [Thermoanaerobaculia bacterium]